MAKQIVKIEWAEPSYEGRVVCAYDWRKREKRELKNDGERIRIVYVDETGEEILAREVVADCFIAGLASTSKLTDAFAEYAAFLTADFDIVFGITVGPHDVGLARLLGGTPNPNWRFVTATFHGAVLLAVNICFSDLDEDDMISVFGPTVTVAECEATTTAALRPRGVIMIPFNYVDVKLSGARGWETEEYASWHAGWRPRHGPMTTFAAELAAVRTAIPGCDLVYAINDRRPYERRHADDGYDEFWVHDAKKRGPYMLAQITQFALALAPCHLSPYVVMWIFDWLPYQRRFANLRRLRWIEGVQRSIAGVLERRQERAKK
jgi:hypothetical protein